MKFTLKLTTPTRVTVDLWSTDQAICRQAIFIQENYSDLDVENKIKSTMTTCINNFQIYHSIYVFMS